MAVLQRILVAAVATGSLAGCAPRPKDDLVPVDRPHDLPIAFGSKVQDGTPLAHADMVPDSVLAVSVVVDTDDDGVLDLDRDITMPCERRSGRWGCEPPTQRAILRTVNAALREIIMTPGPYLVASCDAASCQPVDTLREGTLTVVRECGLPLDSLVLVSARHGDRLKVRELRAEPNERRDASWHLATERGRAGAARIVTSSPPRTTVAADVWVGPAALARPDQLRRVAASSTSIDAVAGTDGTAVRVRLDADLVRDCEAQPDCELWLGLATRAIVARRPTLRVEQLTDDFIPLIHAGDAP